MTSRATHTDRTAGRRQPRSALRGFALAAAWVAAGVGLAAADDGPDPLGTADPAMFVARDDDTTIYLLGTIHLVPCVPGSNPPVCASGITAAIRNAISASDEVWLEIAGVFDLIADPTAVMGLAMFQDGSVLSDFIPEDEIETIAAALVPLFGGVMSVETIAAVIDPMMPWLVTLLLSMPDLSTGSEWGVGVDVEVAEIAQDLGIPVFGFETEAEQMTLLGSDPLEYQIADLRSVAVLLRHGVDLAAIAQLSYAEVWDIWRTGRLEEFDTLALNEVELMAEITDAEIAAALRLTEAEYAVVTKEIEAVYPVAMQDKRVIDADRFLVDRNRNWMSDIGEMLARPGTFFIAVGAAHLVGDAGLPALLEGAGATVARVH